MNGKLARVIARLDIKAPNLIKGIHLEGLRVLGEPKKFALDYYAQGIDEILYMDSVASLYQRNSLHGLLRDSVEDIFIPFTVGGGIRSLDDAKAILKLGADKVALNTAAVKDVHLLKKISAVTGAQAIVLSVECKKQMNGWEVYTDCGRERTGLSVVDWVKNAQQYGVGELLLTSVDREGTRTGYDLELLNTVSEAVALPIIASGGFGTLNDAVEALNVKNVTAIAIADALHYKRFNVSEIKRHLFDYGFQVRL